MPRHAAVSLADFAAAGVRLRPTEAVTIVRSLAMQVAGRRLPGVPSAHVIRLSSSGDVLVEGPVVASGEPVPRAAQLLAALLPGAKPQSAEPTALWRLIDRAVLSPPAFATLDEFAAALAPFAAHDPQAAIRDLTSRWADVQPSDPASIEPRGEAQPAADEPGSAMSVSEMRRTRRGTGLSLDEVSKRSRIPVSLLRQLEWGYLRNWPQGLYGRTQLVRYARAAGLERQLVLDAIWPLVLAQAAAPGAPLPPGSVGDPDDNAILIVQPAFEPDEILFETEDGHQAEAIADTDAGAAGSADTLGPPVGLLDPSSHVEAPRRSSMATAAAVLALATAGAVWGLRESPTDRRGTTPQVVRHVPAAAGQSATASDRLRSSRPSPLPPVLRLGMSAGHAVPTAGVRPATETRTIATATAGRVVPVESSEDDTSSSSAAFQSAGGVEFADPIQPASGESASGLGLRIMRVVDDRSRSYHTRRSPDGTQVAFDSDRDGDRAVFVADANGHHLRRVSGDGFAAMPNWSPDGRRLSYARAEVDNPNVWNLWALDLDSGDSRRLTSNASGRPQGGSWFPDGEHIAYSLGPAIVVLDVASGKPAVYPSPQSGRIAGAPAVSPDGRWVIFQLSGDGAWLLDLNDGTARKVLSDPTVGDFTWSPDGSRVAYYSRRDGEWSVWVTVTR